MSLWYSPRYARWAKYLPRSTIKQIVWYSIRSRISKENCWFVDIPCTGSPSIKQELWEQFGWPYGRNDFIHRTSLLRRDILPYIVDHSTAQHMHMCLGDQLWQKIFTFSMVRNPWSWYLSYFFLHHKGMFGHIIFPSPIVVKPMFGHWLAYILLEEKKEEKFSIRPAREYLLDEDGNMIVDFVAKYENWQENLAYIGEKINYPEIGKKLPLIEHIEHTQGEYHYSEYYDNESRDLVAEFAKWEIEKFNYSFGK